MELLENKKYIEDVSYAANLNLPWQKLKNNTVVIAGAGGAVGSCLIDVLMYNNKKMNLQCKVIALGRNSQSAEKRFKNYWNDELFEFCKCDINNGLENLKIEKVGYVFHMASNTHPIAYATDPIGTITTNIIGTNNLLNFSAAKKADRFVFLSSNEVYGENRGDTEFFDERYCGYINCNTLRAGYPESKRCGEALCQAYGKQKEIDFVIARLTRTYGPTMLMSDSKAISQFIKNGISGEDIILKSEGKQYYSYTYVVDAVSGLLNVCLNGLSGECYNVSSDEGDIMLKDLADIIAQYSGTKVVFQLPDDVEKAGYSTATKARIDGSKIKKLGWRMRYAIKEGIERTIDILKCL